MSLMDLITKTVSYYAQVTKNTLGQVQEVLNEKIKTKLTQSKVIIKEKQAQAQSALKNTAGQLEDYIVKSNVLPDAVMKSLEKPVQPSSIKNKPTPIPSKPVAEPAEAASKAVVDKISAEQIIKTYDTLINNQQIDEAKKIMNDAIETCDQHLNEPDYVACKQTLVAHLQPINKVI
jgi:CRISPR/Cas system-associated protein Cas7 (RAMP superfamily)